MFGLTCPVCKELLKKEDRTYKCSNNHCFDIAKQGYVNLLQSQQSKQKRHGDDKLMIKSRTDFLNKDYYKPLQQLLCQKLNDFAENDCKILDAGCGDCYYTSEIEKTLKSKNPEIIGIDISKDAMIASSKRNKNIITAVASVFALPVEDESFNCVLNVFSPFAPDEYKRVLTKDGFLFRVVPLENHLFELKQSIYDNPLKNPEENTEIQGFQLIDKRDLKYKIKLDNNQDIQNLFKMTPYYYKTSATDQQKLDNLSSLETRIEFELLIYKNIK